MRKIILLIILSSSLLSFGQMDKKTKGGDKLFSADSVIERVQQLKDSVLQERANAEKQRMDEQNIRNFKYILELQKERKAKQKRNAIIRIAIGIGFLLILIIGWRRKVKKK